MSQSPLDVAFCSMSPVTMVFGDGPIFIPPPAIPPPPPPPPPGEHAVAATSVTAARAAYHRAQCLIPTSVEVRNCDEITRSKGLRQRRGFNRPAEARQAPDWGLGSEAVIQANLDAPRASRREVEFGHGRRLARQARGRGELRFVPHSVEQIVQRHGQLHPRYPPSGEQLHYRVATSDDGGSLVSGSRPDVAVSQAARQRAPAADRQPSSRRRRGPTQATINTGDESRPGPAIMRQRVRRLAPTGRVPRAGSVAQGRAAAGPRPQASGPGLRGCLRGGSPSTDSAQPSPAPGPTPRALAPNPRAGTEPSSAHPNSQLRAVGRRRAGRRRVRYRASSAAPRSRGRAGGSTGLQLRARARRGGTPVPNHPQPPTRRARGPPRRGEGRGPDGHQWRCGHRGARPPASRGGHRRGRRDPRAPPDNRAGSRAPAGTARPPAPHLPGRAGLSRAPRRTTPPPGAGSGRARAGGRRAPAHSTRRPFDPGPQGSAPGAAGRASGRG